MWTTVEGGSGRMTSRIEPDSRTMVMLSLTLVGVLAAASFTCPSLA
jgi:hypothetical protein